MMDDSLIEFNAHDRLTETCLGNSSIMNNFKIHVHYSEIDMLWDFIIVRMDSEMD